MSGQTGRYLLLVTVVVALGAATVALAAPVPAADDQVTRVIEVNYANPALITQLFGGAVIYDNAGFLQLGAQGLGLGVTANGQPGLSQGGYNQAPTGQPGYNQAALGQRTYQPGLSPLAPGLGNGPPIGVPATPPGP